MTFTKTNVKVFLVIWTNWEARIRDQIAHLLNQEFSTPSATQYRWPESHMLNFAKASLLCTPNIIQEQHEKNHIIFSIFL